MLKTGENAAFERCIEVMVRLIEKYADEVKVEKVEDKKHHSISDWKEFIMDSFYFCIITIRNLI